MVGNPSLKQYFRVHQLEFGTGVSALTEEDFAFIPQKFLPQEDDGKYWQFQISKANGRVIGFFNEDHTVFYVVFLDPNHNAQLSNYSDYKVRPIEPGISELDDLRARIAKHIELDNALEKQGREILYEGENVYLCIDKDLFRMFDALMKEGSLQARFQDFLIDKL